jgi:hypothetical protein
MKLKSSSQEIKGRIKRRNPVIKNKTSSLVRGVVTATHTYAATTEGPWLLYDDQNDPFQRNNLITWSNRDNPGVVPLQQTMQKKLEYWLERTGDAFEDGGVLNDRYQPGHTGGVLPLERDPFFPYEDTQSDRLAVPFSK